MSVELKTIQALVNEHMTVLGTEHKQKNDVPDYQNIKHGMIYLHTYWQELILCVRNNHGDGKAADAAVKLAAAAIKYAADIGCPRSMKLLHELA